MIAALILAGGQGRRMGGCDKGWQLLAGVPLVRRVWLRVSPQVDGVWISANRNLARYRRLAPVTADGPALAGCGPLAGLAALDAVLPTAIDAVLVVPCDMPLLPADLVARLAACGAPAYAETPEGPQPCVFLVPRAALAEARRCLTRGETSLRRYLARIGARPCRFDDAGPFANANDPTTLARLAAVAASVTMEGMDHA